jgi:hypothetical protein
MAGRHWSDARQHWLKFESPHLPPAARQPAAASISSLPPTPARVSPSVHAWAPRGVIGEACERSAPRAEAAGAKAGPHPDSGRRPAETARVIAGPAVVAPGAGLAAVIAWLGVSALIAGVVVTPATVVTLARSVGMAAACIPSVGIRSLTARATPAT